MDDIYEFENNQHRKASVQIKAIAYDLMIELTEKKKELLKSKVSNNKELMDQLNSISDKFFQITEDFENQLEILDQYEQTLKSLKLEKNEASQIVVESKSLPIKEQFVVENQSPVIEENPKEMSKDSNMEMEKTEDLPDLKIAEVTPQEIEDEEDDYEVSLDDIKEPTIVNSKPKVFYKKSKNMSKAIMVKPNQLLNLKNSLYSQEEILVNKGIFSSSGTTPAESKQNTLAQPIKPVLPDDIERQIEDLTVKASIYYNEGDTAKAEELYRKINELNKSA